MCKKLMFLISLVSLLAAVNSAAADRYTWTNDYPWSVLWDDPLNWDPPGVPGASDEAFITAPPERGPAIDWDTSIGDMHGPRWDSDSNQVIDIVAGTVVVNGEWVWCYSGSGTGTINISGSPDIIINGWLGGIYSGTGILNITDSAIITSNDEWRMVDGSGAVGIFNISGSANITIHERVRLADDGLAILNISGDPNITIDGDLTAGYNSGGTLEAYISGGSLNVGGSFQIGNDGSGVIDISGGTVNCHILKLQMRPDDATGTLNISGGNVCVGESVRICDGSGTATMNMSGGDVYAEGSVRICNGSGTATMNMSGGDVNTGELWLPGGDGTGILNMTGGVLAVRGAILAPKDSGGTSIINLDGGLISCGGFTPAGAYSMNIEEGILVIDGDVRDAVYADIAAGYITAYGRCAGRGDVMVDFDNLNPGKTTVWAVTVFERAWNPYPGCDAEYIPREVVLRWSPGDDAIEHHIFFGTSFDDVNDANLSVYKGSQTGTTYNAGTLSFGVTYYWRIDEISESTYTPGLVWSFTLGDIIVVDYMESYNKSDSYIFWTWADGASNWTSSFLGLGTAPGDPIHGGEQSMIYAYYNNINFGSGYYSEIEREYADPCDWTALGVKALTLCFYGNPNNDAGDTEQMYVGLEDNNDNYVEVRYGDGKDEDMNDIKIAKWQDWNILLSEFNDVNLAKLDKLFIGFGIRGGILPGGTGDVHFDDIRVYPPYCVPGKGPKADLSGNCIVDFADIEIMADAWLETDVNLGEVKEPCDANLIGWWKLDEGDGNVAGDSSGYDHNGVIQTIDVNVSWVAGYDANALEFDGGRVRVPDAQALKPLHQVSACAWIYYSEGQSAARIVVKGGNDKETYEIEVSNEDTLVFQVRDGNDPDAESYPRYAAESNDATLGRDEWIHVAGTYDGNAVKCYINGGLAATNNDANAIVFLSQDTNDLAIGSMCDDDRAPFEGTIDDVRVYNYALSLEEIRYIATDGMKIFSVQSVANLYNKEDLGERAVNLRDFAELAKDWLDVKLYPE